MSQGNEVAAIHSKLDQIIAAYASANTPRGTTPPPSIFSMASDRQTATGAQLDTAGSIMPGGEASAGWDNAAAAAETRAAGSSVLSPASMAVDDDAEMQSTSDSAAVDIKPVAPTPKGVKFFLDDVSIGYSDSRAHGEEAETDAPAEAPTEAPAAATSQKLAKQSAWSRLRSKAASSSSDTSDSQHPAGTPHTDESAAVGTRSPKTSAADNDGSAGDSAGDSAGQEDMAPKPAAAAAPKTAALGAGPVLSAPSMPASGAAADTEVQVAGGVSVPAARPRSSLKKMLRRVLN